MLLRHLRFYFVGCAACLFCTNLHAFENEDNEEPDASTVLQNLKDYDSIFESGFTVSGTKQTKGFSGNVYYDMEHRWRLAFGGDRIGYLIEATDYDVPTYQQLFQQKQRQQSEQPQQLVEGGQEGTDGDKPIRIPVRTKEWGYWGQDLSGHHYEDSVIAVTSSGWTERGTMHNSMLFGPRDVGPVAPLRTIYWSIGRFFSKHIGKVTRVEEAEDGRLIVSALGKKSSYQNGRWELEIEPAAAWMVRKARFYLDSSPDSINVEMTNEGTVWSGSYCIPKTAVINQWGAIAENDGKSTERLTIEPVIEEFDDGLYNASQQAVVHNERPLLTIHDYRVSPPVISQPFRPKPTRHVALAERNNAWRWVFIAVNIMIFIALTVVFIMRKRRLAQKEVPGK